LAREYPLTTVSLYISSLNEVIDLHTERLSEELGFRVPPSVLLGLYGVAILTMALMGVNNSYREKHNLVAEVIVVLIVSVVFILIVELDRSNVGVINIPQNALIDLRDRLIMTP
jgi:hypothetical protein